MSDRGVLPPSDGAPSRSTPGTPLPGPLPGPGAAWTVVCFPPPGCGTWRGVDGLAAATVSVAWHADTGCGRALVRSGVLPDRARGLSSWHPAPCTHPAGRFPCDVHLRVDPDEARRPGLVEHADVLVARAPLPRAAACRRVQDLLARHLGCLVAAAPCLDAGGAAVGVRGGTGTLVRVRGARAEPPGAGLTRVTASLVHAWSAAGSPGALCCVAAVPPGAAPR
ncbi:hypothetical protein [Streptomyces sp. G45]|uniref:hypothetical protein n=1 Tax=Streptomyces sp. G45 TaxID=3406627 RepID=UPI003C25F965